MKLTRLLLIVLMALCLTSPCFAATVSCDGGVDSSGNCRILVESDGLVSFPGGGVKAKYEVKTTDDTLTAVESGTVYYINPTDGSPMTITLPDADVGLTYTFVAINGNNSGNSWYQLAPQSTDTLVAVANTKTAASTYVAGDKVRSNSATGDSITVTCGADTYWYIGSVRGTFTDVN